MIPAFNPLLFYNHLAMAQAAQNNKGLADLQRQYLLDMIPSQMSQNQNNQAPPRGNWKKT